MKRFLKRRWCKKMEHVEKQEEERPETNDSKSDQDIPFVPECEVFYEGGPSLEKLFCDCKKNPGHPMFIPVKDFKIEHLPEKYQTAAHMKIIQQWCDRTVKVSVGYTSKNRPDVYPGCDSPYPYRNLKGSHRVRRCGTGFITKHGVSMNELSRGRPCPCHLCKKSDQPKMMYWQVIVNTATHVVYDDLEAASTVVELFYDSDDREEVEFLYGVWIVKFLDEDRFQTDISQIVCVTHDGQLVDRLASLRQKFGPAKPSGVIISHPHGCSKQITVGNVLYYTVSIPICPPFYFGKNAKCRLPVDFSLGLSNDLGSNSLSPCDKNTLEDSPGFSNPPDGRRKRKVFPPCPMVPGVEYPVPYRMSFALPPEAKHMCRYKNSDGLWVTFPPGTKFTPLGRKDCFLPTETEFYWGDDKKDGERLFTSWIRYVTYDTNTCPGSSGAPVFNHDTVMTSKPWIAHAGSLADGTNRSVFHNGADESKFIVERMNEYYQKEEAAKKGENRE